ncbi:MAG: AAA family ATPase [Ignavibacteria bacterium]|nr:AAA family ATPase [Ignavibacteria bacterium]
MIKNNYFILSGAMGSGKSTILKLLKQKGYLCIDEPARQIISEQRSIDGEGLYDKNPELFAQLMLSRSINLYKLNSEYEVKVIFDRGIRI